MNKKSEYDELVQYCRRLGHDVPFSYCRAPGEPLFCRMMDQCWAARVPVSEFLSENFSQDEISKVYQPPVDKRISLIEIIQKAQEKVAQSRNDDESESV